MTTLFDISMSILGVNVSAEVDVPKENRAWVLDLLTRATKWFECGEIQELRVRQSTNVNYWLTIKFEHGARFDLSNHWSHDMRHQARLVNVINLGDYLEAMYSLE